ncbi:MAG: hypothetical protein AMJ93_04095 [Anaerolineae bacterium SM23_84]|nr:MAG: hypothetical protein AMJ93_04095 [Anaerolineae bacterium SM23_84]
MIVAEQKPLAEIRQLISGFRKVLVLGCGTCVTVCFAGGEKEVGVLASSLRMATKLDGNEIELMEATVQRQCEYEYNEAVADLLSQVDAVLSLACGIGVQTMNEQFPQIVTVPGLNTAFLGQPTEQGVWEERCQACGDCVLGTTAGICPISRCAKSLPCAWQEIYDRMASLGRLELLLEPKPMKDWRTSRDGGARRIVREDLRQ